MSETPFGESPQLEDFKYGEVDPGFIAKKDEPKSFEDLQEARRIQKEAVEEAGKLREESASTGHEERDTLKPKPYKVGDVNLDDFPTDVSRFS
jgi:hypothetical protein